MFAGAGSHHEAILVGVKLQQILGSIVFNPLLDLEGSQLGESVGRDRRLESISQTVGKRCVI